MLNRSRVDFDRGLIEKSLRSEGGMTASIFVVKAASVMTLDRLR
jgi:hypothetical protein